MNINTNTWNKIRYTIYAPGYDLAAWILRKSRRKAIELLAPTASDSILIIGAGTGLDLEYLPAGCNITATDITPAMISKTIRRNKKYKHKLCALVMDGQKLTFADNSFDKVILNLILSVIPNPVACLKEAERVLKPGGEVIVYDKFIKKGKTISAIRRLANLFTNALFSNINRSFEQIMAGSQFTVLVDQDADFGGNFRLIKLKNSNNINFLPTDGYYKTT
jgi:phosphatidylethanolamine/phosphatidyl-N-methylethanolamine N-methyltransferase